VNWADDACASLTALWLEGLPAAEIGRRLRTSKDAVIGKAHRLGLPGRKSPIRKAGTGERPRCMRPPARVEPAALIEQFVPVVVPSVRVGPIPPATRCCMPLWGDGGRPTHRHCDAPVTRPTSFTRSAEMPQVASGASRLWGRAHCAHPAKTKLRPVSDSERYCAAASTTVAA
jgi:hypothetical protein